MNDDQTDRALVQNPGYYLSQARQVDIWVRPGGECHLPDLGLAGNFLLATELR